MTATARAERLIIEDPEFASPPDAAAAVAPVLALLRLMPAEARALIVEGLGGMGEAARIEALDRLDCAVRGIARATASIEEAESFLERGASGGVIAAA